MYFLENVLCYVLCPFGTVCLFPCCLCPFEVQLSELFVKYLRDAVCRKKARLVQSGNDPLEMAATIQSSLPVFIISVRAGKWYSSILLNSVYKKNAFMSSKSINDDSTKVKQDSISLLMIIICFCCCQTAQVSPQMIWKHNGTFFYFNDL